MGQSTPRSPSYLGHLLLPGPLLSGPEQLPALTLAQAVPVPAVLVPSDVRPNVGAPNVVAVAVLRPANGAAALAHVGTLLRPSEAVKPFSSNIRNKWLGS